MPGSGNQAMVVASDADLREALCTVVTRLGFGARSHDCADEALAALLSGPSPRCLLAQADLPGTSGARLRDLLATALPSVPVAVVTTQGQGHPDQVAWPAEEARLVKTIGELAARRADLGATSDLLILDPDAVLAPSLVAESLDLAWGLPIGLLQTHPDGRVLAMNRTCAQIARCPDGAVQAWFSRGIRAIYADPRDRDRMLADISEHGVVRDVTVAIQRYDGTQGWVRVNARMYPGRPGEPGHIDTSLLDVTAEHDATANLESDLALERVRSAVLEMTDEGDWWHVVHAFAQAARGVMHFVECGVNLVDCDRQEMRGFNSGDPNGDLGYHRTEIGPALALVVQTGQAMVRERGDALFGNDFRAEINSVVDVPFSGGTVALNSTEFGAFGPREIGLLEHYAKVMTTGHRRLLDLQARALAEAETRQSKERYEELVRRIPIGVYVYRVTAAGERLIEYASPQLARMTGHAAEDLQGDAALAFGMIHPDDLADFVQHNIETTAALTPFRWEGRAVVAGEVRHIRMESDPTPLPNGDSVWSGIVIDVTEQRAAADELRRSQERYHSFVANSHEAIYCTEFDQPIDTGLPTEEQIDAIYAHGYLGECNAAMAAMYGFEATEQFVGQRLVDFHGGSDNPANRDVFRRFIASNYRALDSETEEYLPDGQRRYFLSSDVGVVSDDRLLRIWGTASDVTERRLAEQALRRRDELLAAAAQAGRMLLTQDDLPSTLAQIVDRIGPASGQDRAYLFEFHPDTDAGQVSASLRYEWVRDGVEPQMASPQLQDIPFAELAPYSWSRLGRGECVCARVADLPETERAVLEPQGILSLLLVPIQADGAAWGFIGFDACTAAYDWRAGEQAALMSIAAAIGGAVERLRAAQALRESMERNRTLVDANPDSFFVISADGTILDAKTERADSLLPPATYFVGKHVSEVLPDDTAALTAAKMAEVLLADQPVTYTYSIEFPSGWHDFECRLVHWGADSLMAVIRDVTERRQAEAERERLMVAIEQAAETVVITDAQGTIQYANPMFEQVTGYARAEVIGQNPRILKSDQQDAETYRDLWRTISQGGTWVGRLINRRRDGTLFTEEASISPVRDHNGVVTNYVAVKRDITSQLSLEARLAQAQKMESVGRLAGGVAHDFNNMLGVILGHAETVLEQVEVDSPLHADLEEIRKAALRSADLTRQLLAFARQQTISPRVLDLNHTVGGMLRMLQRLIGESVALDWQPADNLWPVCVDPSQIDQILANLCVNARDAIGGSGRVTITTSNRTVAADQADADLAQGEYVCLAVTDDGSGMDPHTQARIFEPFFTTKQLGEGTGLGLATVYGAVRQNDGVVRVDSSPGQGTTFRIFLPRHLGDGAGESQSAPSHRPRRGEGTILLVEDEPAILRMAQRMLGRRGYTVLAAPTPSDALRVVQEHDGAIDLVMTDVVMPEMNGRQLVEAIRQLRPGIGALFMSGYTADAIADHGVLDAGVEFIAKPFTTRDLAATVERILGSQEPA